MTTNALEKARAAAEKAAQDLAALESAEAEKAAQKAAERDARQRELDTEFLSRWEPLDAELQESSSRSGADAVYAGEDPVSAVAVFWVGRAKRNAIRAHARDAYRRLHGVDADDSFARELKERDMRLAEALEDAIVMASRRHGADLADALDAEWMVPDGA